MTRTHPVTEDFLQSYIFFSYKMCITWLGLGGACSLVSGGR